MYLGRTGSELCPVATAAGYLVVRGGLSGPYFWFSSGIPLSSELLVKHMRAALLSYGKDVSKYSRPFPDWCSYGSLSSGSGRFHDKNSRLLAELSIPVVCENPARQFSSSIKEIV